ncbi:MAG: DUF6057 family protein [Dysgonamonadaceae bacterium]|jgi:hypothetical protein|nr:DUF6057 family protein [Dysgonamonadaceae bacterium]
MRKSRGLRINHATSAGKSRVVGGLTPALFFIAFAAWYLFLCPYHLYFKEQLTLFDSRLTPYLDKPASICFFFSDYLTQFFLLTGVGCLIIVVLLVLFWLSISIAFKKIGLQQNALLALFPVAAEGALACLTEYPLAMLIGSIIATCIFIAICSIKNCNICRVLGFLSLIALYIVIGAHFLVFFLLFVALEIKKKRKPYFSLALLIVAITTPIIIGYFCYLTVNQSFFYPIIDRCLLKKPFLFLLTEASIIIAIFFDKIRYKAALTVAVFGVAAAELSYLTDFKEEYNLGLTCEAYFGHDNKVKSLINSSKYATQLGSYYGNLIAAKEGKLADGLLKRFQPAYLGLFLEIRETDSYINLMSAPDALMQYGDMAQAQHSAMLAMLFTPHQHSSRMVRTLATIAITNGDYPIAEKYLDILCRTTFHKKWAEDNLKFIAEDTTFRYAGKRALLAQSDILFASNDWRRSIINLLQSNPQNGTAVDYLLCYSLLNKDLKQFKEDYETFYRPVFGLHPPTVYQEALIMTTEEYSEYGINSDVQNRSDRFLTLYENALKNEHLIRSNFSESYWFYYFFAEIK